MRNVVDNIDALDALLLQQVNGGRLLFVENGYERVGAGHFLAPAGLHVEDRAAKHALEAQGRLRVPIPVPGGNQRRRSFDVLVKGGPQTVQVRTDLEQDILGNGVVEERQQQVLHRQKLVAFRLGVLERLGDRRIHVLAEQHR